MADSHPVGAGTGAASPRTRIIARGFSWGMLAVLAAFLINNVLDLWLGAGLPVRLAVYALCIGLAMFHIHRTRDAVLREESEAIVAFNTWLIRGCFWAVMLTGCVDLVLSFLKVERLAPDVFGEELAKDLARSLFRGPFVHVPLIIAGFLIALRTRTLGFQWLALGIVVAELAIVFSRFIFSYEQAFMGDLVRFWYAALFLFASAYTLYEDGHVRVDVFYSAFDPRRKGRVNAWGSILLGMTLCWCILLVGLNGKASIINSPILNFEATQTQTGLMVKYMMAGFLGIFAISMLIQFVAYLLESVADANGEPGKRQIAALAH